MKAKKGNKSYKITEIEVNKFQSAGFDIYDDNGALVKYGTGKTVAADKYLALQKENDSLKEQITLLAEKLEKKAKTTKKKEDK